MNPFDLLANPQMMHGVVAHFPVALSVVGVLLVLLGATSRMSNSTVRWLTVAFYLLIAGAAYGAFFTGQGAQGLLSPALPDDVRGILDTHHRLPELSWILPLLTAALAMLCIMKIEWFRAILTMLAVLLSLATAGWMCVITLYGDTLVYKYGIGTPGAAPNVKQTSPAPPAPEKPPSEELRRAPRNVPEGREPVAQTPDQAANRTRSHGKTPIHVAARSPLIPTANGHPARTESRGQLPDGCHSA